MAKATKSLTPPVTSSLPAHVSPLARWLGYPSPEDVPELETVQLPSPDAKPSDDTVTLLYDGVQAQLAAQDGQVTSLDTKSGTVLASASLLTAAAVALQSLVLQHRTSPWAPLAHAVEVFAILIYVALVYASLRAYALKGYEFVPNPLKVPKYLFETPEFVKSRLLFTAADAYRTNDITIRQKVWWTKAALVALLIEGLVLALAALIQIFI